MKIIIKKPIYFFSCYDLAKVLLFWLPTSKDEYGFKINHNWVDNLGEWLTYGSIKRELEVGEIEYFTDRKTTWFYSLLHKIYKLRLYFNRNTIKIEAFDIENIPGYLSLIILPLLKKAQKEAKSLGVPLVDDEDVPEHLKYSPEYKKRVADYDHDTEIELLRWQYVLNEMIASFQLIHNGVTGVGETWDCDPEDGTDQNKTPLKWGFKKLPCGNFKLVSTESKEERLKKLDKFKVKEEKLKNGLRLFGKYFRNFY